MPFVGKLICLDGQQRGREVVLDRDELNVGRDPDCHIVLDDKFASRVHASITRVENVFFVEDAGSKNGVRLNNQRLEAYVKAPLADGNIVVFAQTRFRYEDPAATMTNLDAGALEGAARLALHQASREVLVDGRRLQPPLSLKQYELLACLFARQDQAVSKGEIARYVWPEEAGEIPDSNIDRLVSRVRQRLAEASGGSQFIATVRGFGFRLENPTT